MSTLPIAHAPNPRRTYPLTSDRRRGRGVTYCSPPQRFYWFNPVEVLVSELLAGATIALPSAVTSILTVIRLSSQIMFGFFLSGCVLSFLLIGLTPLALRSRWWSLPLGLTATVVGALLFSAAAVGTLMGVAFRVAMTSQQDLNISASVGTPMLVLMWLAAAFATVATVFHVSMGCLCLSRRDVRTGRARATRFGTIARRPESASAPGKGSGGGGEAVEPKGPPPRPAVEPVKAPNR